jgi:hypothetical protein
MISAVGDDPPPSKVRTEVEALSGEIEKLRADIETKSKAEIIDVPRWLKRKKSHG